MRDRIKETFGRVDPEILGGLLVLVLLLLGFLELAEAVGGPSPLSTDQRILMALRDGDDLSDPLGPAWFEELVRDITALGGMAVIGLITLFVIGYLLLQKRPRSALFLVVAVIGGVILGDVLKMLYDRPRPDVVPHLVEVISESFPSGHSAMSAVVYPTLGAMMSQVVGRQRVRMYLLLVSVFLALLVGTSRVYLGVHYPTDVVAGWALGFAWALACWLVVRVMQRRRQVEPAPSSREGGSGDEAAEGDEDAPAQA